MSLGKEKDKIVVSGSSSSGSKKTVHLNADERRTEVDESGGVGGGCGVERQEAKDGSGLYSYYYPFLSHVVG